MKYSLRSLFVAVTALAVGLFAVDAAFGHEAAALFFLSLNLAAGALTARPEVLGAATLTTPVLLLDVMQAFRKFFPALGNIGTEFKGTPLKLNNKYYAHIATYGSASTYDTVTGYANGANTARNGLTDVPVVVDQQPTYPLKWLHLDEIKDIKNQYQKVMDGAGYTLGKKAFDDGVAAKMTSRYFTQENISATADCDYDWLNTLTTALNGKGVMPTGRTLFVNSAVAQTLAADPRMTSKLFAGQLVDGNAYRQWFNVGGFALIQEYPDLPSNNGTALTSATATAASDLITATAHGLVTGDPVVLSAIGSGTAGLAINTRYWAIKSDANNIKVATTYANAIAGTQIDITSYGTGITLKLAENLVAFACDGRAFGFMAGVPDGFQSQIATQLGIPPTMLFDNPVRDPLSGLTMGAVKWMEVGTGNLFWCPTFVYGTNAGKQADTAVAGNSASANSILAAASLTGAASDYAGLRITTGT